MTWSITQHVVYQSLGSLILSHYFQLQLQAVICLSPSCCISAGFGRKVCQMVRSFTPGSWSGTASVKILQKSFAFKADIKVPPLSWLNLQNFFMKNMPLHTLTKIAKNMSTQNNIKTFHIYIYILCIWFVIKWLISILHSIKALHMYRPIKSQTYRCQWIQSSLIREIACHMFGGKPLPKARLTYCQLNPWGQILLNRSQTITRINVDQI